MTWWARLTSKTARRGPAAKHVDYVAEALALERVGDYDGALTSYRLALREKPNDAQIHANMAIAFSKIGQEDEAVRAYRRALGFDPALPGAHYGLGFLLLRRGEVSDAAFHLESFLMHPPAGEDAERWIAHARKTLDEMRTETPDTAEQEPLGG